MGNKNDITILNNFSNFSSYTQRMGFSQKNMLQVIYSVRLFRHWIEEVTYTDFSIAFDKINHNLILTKLERLRFKSKVDKSFKQPTIFTVPCI